MTELDLIRARLVNTEKALNNIVMMLLPLHPPDTQQQIGLELAEYMQANESLKGY
jgi:hypothetical protein